MCIRDSPVGDQRAGLADLRAGVQRVRAVIELGDPVDEVALCLLYTSPSPRDRTRYRMPSSA